MENKLSKKEQELLDLITTSEERVTVDVIKGKLGNQYVGAIGRLVSMGKVDSKKEFVDSDANPAFGKRKMKFYVIKQEEPNDDAGIEK